MRDLSKIINDEIKYGMAYKLETIVFELIYHAEYHREFLSEHEMNKMIEVSSDIMAIVYRLKEEL